MLNERIREIMSVGKFIGYSSMLAAGIGLVGYIAARDDCSTYVDLVPQAGVAAQNKYANRIYRG